ncbi:hypothetical protein BCV70DRAFT_200368 [Testicularia cyperi]|uniref:CREG-like beta-barrel domain-containing protein n=1 Tax=Testicularia cyperi TaxID=1882483 RepID=A0A317XS93_9BASI|nr:hypothetical protein BCV70DRAFT_200368 [Testicularia cyperi]
MKLSAVSLVTVLLAGASASAWETKSQALLQAVELVNDPHVFGVASLSTKYASDHPVSELAGLPITGPEYFAPCYPDSGDLLFLGLTVSQTWRNILHSDTKNGTASIGSNPDPSLPDRRHLDHPGSHHWAHGRPSWRKGMPSKGRATLFGHFELTNATEQPELAHKLGKCYLRHHPDASHWAPGATDSPHVPFWASFVVDRVYWVGGFGDEHFIGWFNQSEWRDAWAGRSQSAQIHRSDASEQPSLHQLFGESTTYSSIDEPLLTFQH